jgi:DNA adenine methylase
MSAPALRAPFPWFGGKSRAAHLVWEALGNVANYVEPFFGSGAVLLARPHPPRVETVNDADGMVANFWRAVAADPGAVAHHADWPVNEADLHARHRWLIGQRESLTERLIADPEWFDARAAGWWCWGACAWIGDGWCVAEVRKLPHLGDAGRGVNNPSRQLPHLGNPGMDAHAPRRGRAVGTDHVDVTDVRDWMAQLSARLRGVRVACGDWHRVVASPTVLFPEGRAGGSTCGVYLDPPYAEGRADYATGGTGTDLSARVRAWCETHGDNPRVRIVLSGYAGEHDALSARGWRVVEWRTKGGYSSAGGDNANQRRERLWLSPHCEGARQLSLLGGGA